MDEFTPSRIGLLVVLSLATLLIGIVLRSPDTHSNLWNGIRDGYTRTEVAVVAEEGKTAVAEASAQSGQVTMSLQSPLWMEMPKDEALREIPDPGQRLYIASGCARCHGLNGRGGVVGPSLAGRDPRLIAAMARLGPEGMPAFPTSTLSDSELAEIGAYLSSLKPSVSKPRSTEVPQPAAPPPSVPQSTTPSGAPVPAAIGDAAGGKAVFAARCAACHGEAAAGGLGPSLIGLEPDRIEKGVRQGKGGMPRFQTGTLKDQELQDILTYIRSLSSRE